MEKIMVSVSRDEVLKAISKFPKEDLKSFLAELELLLREDRKLTTRYVAAEGFDKLSGLISIGGDAVADAEEIYD